jgi:D-alanyl-lipoteichoic acid acyltransferase DltB (MBOAT superfamily)
MLSFNFEFYAIFKKIEDQNINKDLEIIESESSSSINNKSSFSNKNREGEKLKDNIILNEKENENLNINLSENEYLKILTNSILDLKEFNLLNYFIYIFYPPVYFSGPTILFNSFITQINYKFHNENNNNNKNPFSYIMKLIYLIRFIFVTICFSYFNRYIYVNLFLTNSNNSHILQNDKFNYYSYSLFCFFLLIFIWFKFTVIWRSARVYAMFDNILTEENMNRCMYNNYCFEGFWRAWHRSFNVWLIRYIFIPLGGSKYKFINIWIIFTFVALWHDIKINLLLWGWFICVFMIPEIFVKSFFSRKEVIYK